MSFLSGSFEPYMWVPAFLKSNYMMSFIKKNTFCMRNEKQGRQKTQKARKIWRSLVLNRIAKWTDSVLNRVRVWRPRRHTPTQTSPKSPQPTLRSVTMHVKEIFWIVNFPVVCFSRFWKRKFGIFCPVNLATLPYMQAMCDFLRFWLTQRYLPKTSKYSAFLWSYRNIRQSCKML